MPLSWGTRLPEELLLLVKTALGVDFLCPPPLPHPQSSLFPPISLSFYTSPIIPLLLPLLLLIHWQAPPASSLLLFSKPTPPPPPPHPFIPSSLCSSPFSKDSVNQTESQRRDVYPAGAWTCRGPCSGDGMRLLEHTRTHLENLRPPILAFYVSVISIHWPARCYYANNNLPSNSL